MPETPDYQPPVSALLKIGRPEEMDVAKWVDYPAQYGLKQEHIPELIRLMQDDTFYATEWWDEPEQYALIHAYRTLGQLQSDEALVALIHKAETETDVDWVWEEIPHAIAMYGPDALPEIDAALQRSRQTFIQAVTLLDCLKEIAAKHPETQDHYHNTIISLLKESGQNDPGVNGDLVARIAKNKLEEALPIAKAAFEQNHVDEMITGDYDDLLVDFGLKEPDPKKKREPNFPLPHVPSMPEKLTPDKSIKELREERKQRKKAEREAKQNKKKDKK